MKSLNIFILAVFAFAGVFFSDAYAYLDPASGTIILQGLLGVLIGAVVTLKIYWVKIRYYFENKSKKTTN